MVCKAKIKMGKMLAAAGATPPSAVLPACHDLTGAAGHGPAVPTIKFVAEADADVDASGPTLCTRHA